LARGPVRDQQRAVGVADLAQVGRLGVEVRLPGHASPMKYGATTQQYIFN
jgi:hypothetical protein